MKTIKYLGGIHALTDGEEDIYLGADNGQPVSIAAGDEADVSDEKAAQLTADFPGCFAIDGKTVGSKPKPNPAAADDADADENSDADGDDLAGQLMAHTRAELDAAAAELGIDDPAALPNKQAVVNAIVAKKAEDAAE